MKNKVINTKSASIWLDQNGIINVSIFPGAEVNIHHAKEYTEIAKQFGDNKYPILVDISKIKSTTREAREHFKGGTGSKNIKSVALIVGSPVSRVIGNFLIGINKPEYPIKLFSKIDEAIDWLEQFLE
jgi:hypothetical protein